MAIVILTFKDVNKARAFVQLNGHMAEEAKIYLRTGVNVPANGVAPEIKEGSAKKSKVQPTHQTKSGLAVLDAFRKSGLPMMSIDNVAEAMPGYGLNPSTGKTVCGRLANEGKLIRVAPGVYKLPE